jgi:tRNA(Ile)-lysidine synthase TilS/MesJ
VVRRIDELTRGVTARDEYEVETRNIRYDLYAETIARTGAPSMLVGHHRGDVQENIICNLFKVAREPSAAWNARSLCIKYPGFQPEPARGRVQGKSLLQINGMTPVSHVNRVAVWRPMLIHDKAVVFDFAHTYGVPYFKDTTPTWSNRGKLRNQLMPLLGVRQPSLPQAQAGGGILSRAVEKVVTVARCFEKVVTVERFSDEMQADD